ncbi:MAG TPA: hypothetical protein VF622_17950 [Segetibacter sp.]|jgi:hypothetical protein
MKNFLITISLFALLSCQNNSELKMLPTTGCIVTHTDSFSERKYHEGHGHYNVVNDNENDTLFRYIYKSGQWIQVK